MEETVYVVDDDPSVRKGLSRLLNTVGFNVEAFSSAQDFLKHRQKDQNGCILLDVRMPGMSGLDMQKKMNKSKYNLPVVFITGHGDVPMSVQAMKKGAVNFLTKPVDKQNLLNAIKEAIKINRQKRIQRDNVRTIRNRLKKLTSREHEVFLLVITGMLNKQISSKLGISEKTVKIHRGRVMKKMQVASVANLVYLAQQASVAIPSVFT